MRTKRRAPSCSRREDFQRGVINALVADVATTWFRLREIDEEIAIIQRTIESQSASLELVRSLKRNGVASATEEMQALSQLAATRSQLPQAELTRVQTENLLRLLLGDAPGPGDTRQPAVCLRRSLTIFPSACRHSCSRVDPTCASSRTNCTPPRRTSASPRPAGSRTCRSA